MDVTGMSAEAIQAIADASIVAGEVNAAGNLVLTSGGGVESNAGLVIRPAQVDIFTGSFGGGPPGSGDYEKPDGAVLIHAICIGAGGGGGGGGIEGGGSGGGGGAFMEAWYHPNGVPALVTCTPGDEAQGGLAGFNGQAGSASSFGALLRAIGGGAGTSPKSGGYAAGARGNLFAGNGGLGSGDATPGGGARVDAIPDVGEDAIYGGAGGGGGASSAAAATVAGASGGAAVGGLIPGGISNVAGASAGLLAFLGGSGGGGGSITAGGVANPGKNGGGYGAGGGGGGAITTPGTRAAGGKGTVGLVVVITYF